MQFQQRQNLPGLDRYRGVINGFIVGLVVGMFIGWFFHGFVGLIVRLGFVLVLLIPLAIIVWYFFLRRKVEKSTRQGGGPGGMQVFTWSSDQRGQRYTTDPRQQRRPGSQPEPGAPASRQSEDDIIDLEFEELKQQVDDQDRRS